MAIGSLVLRELKISNSCYMAAAIEFNYAMFHIFSGPLFANLQGYVFFDLLIWGVSPLIFEICRVRLRQNIQPKCQGSPQDYSRLVVKRRFGWLIGCFVAIVISYLFMNYSETFRWNYFSRIVNLDFGYLLFDLSCRCMELVVQVEEEQQHRALVMQQRDTLQPVYHEAGYCKYRNMFMMASYFLVFYLSTIYDPNEFTSGKDIFNSLSAFSCIFTLTIPLLYLFRNRPDEYGLIPAAEQIEADSGVREESSWQWSNEIYFAFGLISFSFFVNTSYFSMWIMQGLKKEQDQPYQQFNKTLFISSAFFLAASFLQFVVAHSYIGCKLQQGLTAPSSKLFSLITPFLFLYGLLIIVMFSVTKTMEWHCMVVPIIPFGFHYILVSFLCEKVAILKQSNHNKLGHHKIFFYCESIAYLGIPAVLTVLGLTNSALQIFGYLSGVSLIAAAWLFRNQA